VGGREAGGGRRWSAQRLPEGGAGPAAERKQSRGAEGRTGSEEEEERGKVQGLVWNI
jgi:hypothetical protein